MIRPYGNNLEQLILTEYPEHAWQRWKFGESEPWFFDLKSKALNFDPVAQAALSEFVIQAWHSVNSNFGTPVMLQQFSRLIQKQIGTLGGLPTISDMCSRFGLAVATDRKQTIQRRLKKQVSDKLVNSFI